MATDTILQDCRACSGYGLVIEIRPTDMYDCGYIREARDCEKCKGSGQVSRPAPRFTLLKDLLWVCAGIAAVALFCWMVTL